MLVYFYKIFFEKPPFNIMFPPPSDNLVYVFKRDCGAPILKLPGHTRLVSCVSWNPVYTDCFVSGSDDTSVRLWGPRISSGIIQNQISLFHCFNTILYIPYSYVMLACVMISFLRPQSYKHFKTCLISEESESIVGTQV